MNALFFTSVSAPGLQYFGVTTQIIIDVSWNTTQVDVETINDIFKCYQIYVLFSNTKKIEIHKLNQALILLTNEFSLSLIL